MCLLEYAQDTAVTRVQAQLQYVLSASGQFALPPASSNENQSHAGLDGAGPQYILPRVLQTDVEHKGSQPFSYLDFMQQRYKCGYSQHKKAFPRFL